MMRTPLRPLARVIEARRRGEDPDAIERENRRLRQERMQDRTRRQAGTRLVILTGVFIGLFAIVGARMGLLATTNPVEPRAVATGNSIVAQRADITDRRGRVLATNLSTYALYAQPPNMIDARAAAQGLAEIFPDLDAGELHEDFTGSRKFLWIKKQISPEQRQMVHDIGDPGLLFGPREMRLYPNGRLASHVLGGASFGREGVRSAEVIGVAGIEKTYDAWLRDPANGGAPLQLSIDTTVQTAMQEVLEGGMTLLNAKGAAGVMMDIHTGEILAMASLPDFDPNDRPVPLTTGEAGDSPLFNRAVQGVYELGSSFKIFTVAQAMELNLVGPETMVDGDAPLRWGRHTIREFRNKNYGPLLTATDVIVLSSNVGTANLALEIGGERQRAFLSDFGLFDPSPVELVEAPGAAPLVPVDWPDIVTITASYGHGFSTSPLHLASAYASLANGGTRVVPTLLRRETPQQGERLVSPEVSAAAVDMLRAVVTRGTASFGEVTGYQVAGKTGTANKPLATGRGYHDDKNITTFVAVFPASDPQYALVVSLDEASDNAGSEPRRTAGWTAVPVAAEVIRRTAPLLGLPPVVEPRAPDTLTLASEPGSP